jgi:hypothetical protein
MNLTEYSKIMNEVFEKIEKETGKPFSKDVEILTIHKFLSTPAMKDAYPNINVYHDPNDNDLIIEYKKAGYYKFYGTMGQDGFEFRSKIDNKSTFLGDMTPIISEEIQRSALKIKEHTQPNSKFEDFLNNITIKDIDNVMLSCNRAQSDFLKVVKMIKEEDPLSRDFLKLALKVAKKAHQNDRSIDNNVEDTIYNIIKNGGGNGDGYSYDSIHQMRRLFYIENMDMTNYDFEDIEDERQFEFFNKFVADQLPKNSITYLLLTDPNNFIYNAVDQSGYEHIKKSLSFAMKLVSNDLTLEQLYKENPVVDTVFNEALKQDPTLNELPENLFKHTVVKDEDIYTQEKGIVYFNYVDHIVDEFEKPKAMDEHFKTDFCKRSYGMIDPELDVDVIRFIGTTGVDIKYMMCAGIAKNDESNYKTLRLDSYRLTHNMPEGQLEAAIKQVINYCKENQYVLCLDFASTQQGLNFAEADIVLDTVDKFKNEICAVLLPSSSERTRLSLISKLDIPYADIVANEKKITEMIDLKLSEDDMIKTLKGGSKPLKLKM